MKRELIIIDPQNDFCLPAKYSDTMPDGGTLYVPGAEADMSRVADMIRKNPQFFSDIHVTMDSHYRLHIAHPINWVNSAGDHPAPFTMISHADVQNGTWRAFKPSRQRIFESYVESLEKNGRYVLVIWPEHCLIGSVGWAVFPELYKALNFWEGERYGFVDFVTKGSNNNTEHYSAVQADVQYPNDPSTQLNTTFIQALEEADELYISGEALNFCVANTFKDVADNFRDASYISKLILLEDATSEIPGYEHLTKAFMNDLTSRGMRIGRTTDI